MSTDTTKRKHSGLIPFRPGQSGNPNGRPKGSRNKLAEEFLDAMSTDFQAHGVKAIERVREESPEVYLKVIAAVIPKDLTIRGTPMEELTDEALEKLIAELLRSVRGEDATDHTLPTNDSPKRSREGIH